MVSAGHLLSGQQPMLGGTVRMCCHKAESSLGFCRLGRVQITICFLIYSRNKNQFGNVCFSNEAFALPARCVGAEWLYGGFIFLPSSPGPPPSARASCGWCSPAARVHTASGNSAARLRSWRAAAASASTLFTPRIQPNAFTTRYTKLFEKTLFLSVR